MREDMPKKGYLLSSSILQKSSVTGIGSPSVTQHAYVMRAARESKNSWEYFFWPLSERNKSSPYIG